MALACNRFPPSFPGSRIASEGVDQPSIRSAFSPPIRQLLHKRSKRMSQSSRIELHHRQHPDSSTSRTRKTHEAPVRYAHANAESCTPCQSTAMTHADRRALQGSRRHESSQPGSLSQISSIWPMKFLRGSGERFNGQRPGALLAWRRHEPGWFCRFGTDGEDGNRSGSRRTVGCVRVGADVEYYLAV